MSDDAPPDRAVMAIIERFALAAEWVVRTAAEIKTKIQTTLHGIR
jgi:hypothetical protein